MASPTPAWLVSFDSTPVDDLFAKFGGHRSYRNGDINSCINSFMDTLEKVELIALIRHIAGFLKSGIPNYNSEVPGTAGRKMKGRRRAQAVAKSYTFHANAKTPWHYIIMEAAGSRCHERAALKIFKIPRGTARTSLSLFKLRTWLLQLFQKWTPPLTFIQNLAKPFVQPFPWSALP